MYRYWHWSIYLSIFYAVSIFAIQRWMKNREKYDLRRPLFVWSLTLSLFSMWGFYVAGTAHIRLAWDEGWENSLCTPLFAKGRLGLWTFLFCFSKLPELCDTYFIVLRKQKLMFLHWYHHITVFVYCWFHYGGGYLIRPGQWFVSMNYFVHSIMYLYYAVRASGRYRPPIWVNIIITSLQLLQMIVGVIVNVYVCWRMSIEPTWYCDGIVETTYFYVNWAFAMYFSYFILFAYYFYDTYFCKQAVNRFISTPQPTEATIRVNRSSETKSPNETANTLHHRSR